MKYLFRIPMALFWGFAALAYATIATPIVIVAFSANVVARAFGVLVSASSPAIMFLKRRIADLIHLASTAPASFRSFWTRITARTVDPVPRTV